MNAAQLFTGLAGLAGARAAGGDDHGIVDSHLLNGVEYARATNPDETRLRATFRRRQGGGATPLVVIADDPEAPDQVRVLGPQKDGPLRRLRAEALLGVVERTVMLPRLQAVRLVAEEVERLDTERVAGLKVRGLGTEHLYSSRLPGSPRWPRLRGATEAVNRSGWRELLSDLGYAISPLARQGHLCTFEGRPVLVVHAFASATQFARLDERGRLPEGALIADCEAHGARYGALASGTRLRLLAIGGEEAGTATRYVELDAATLESADAPLLGLLGPEYLAEGGLPALLGEARDYGQQIRKRLDLVLRLEVLPRLGSGLGRWAREEGRDVADDTVRAELESATLLFVFRALFLLYAESAGHLPMSNATYAAKSLTRTAERAWLELDEADERAAALWDDVLSLVRKMRTGQRAWDLPAYNGDLFATDGVLGAQVLESAAIVDADLAPALVALARDPDDPSTGIDFSGLEIGHLGYVYEGLLSLRLSVADRDYAYDARKDRYVAPGAGQAAEIPKGELLWLTDEGGRKGGGVYYTRTELVRHLVRGAVGPAFDEHLAEVRELAERDPAAAGLKLFDFYVLDPACGSGHFLVEVVDELADKIARLLGELTLPAVREQLERLRAGAGATWGAGIEDTALLKRLVLKRCVYGVDLSPMGAEIAKVSLWLHAFVPGLSLAYLDHNIQHGNSLIGVARPEAVAPPGDQVALFGEGIGEAMAAAAEKAAVIRAMNDATPGDFASSRQADEDLHEAVKGARRIFDLWTAEALGVVGAREQVLLNGDRLLAGESNALAEEAGSLGRREPFLHWPIAFAEVFARERPGFDAVVGNPPWDEVRVEEPAFYARYRPGLRALAERDRLVELDRLRSERPELVDRLAAERERVGLVHGYLNVADGYERSAGDPDLYKAFCQRYRQVLRTGGALGVVLPRTALTAKGSAGFRSWLLEHAPPERIDVLVNRGRWAFDVEPRYSVALLQARRRRVDEEDHGFEVAGVADSPAAFDRQAATTGLRLRRPALGRLLEVPMLPRQTAADVLAKLRRGAPFPFGGGAWRCFPLREFHETDDKALWSASKSEGGWPLWKGASFDQYRPHGAETRLCPPTEAALAVARKRAPGKESLMAEHSERFERVEAVERTRQRARVSFRDVSRATDSRTVRACLIPPQHFLSNTAPYLAFLEDDTTKEAAALAVLNSLVFDWQARRFVELHLNYFLLEGLRLPEFEAAYVASIAEHSARLSCPDERFADFATATGVEVGPLSEVERDDLRARIDALVARAYELTADELEVIFGDFTLDAVPEDYRDRVRAHFLDS